MEVELKVLKEENQALHNSLMFSKHGGSSSTTEKTGKQHANTIVQS